MKRFGLLLASLGLLPFAPSVADAQAFTANLEVRIDGKVRKNDATVYISKDQCGDGAVRGNQGSEFKFKITGYTANINNLEMWVTASDGTDCSTAASRTYSATSTRSCWLVTSLNGVSDRAEFTVNGEDIFRANGGMQSSGLSDAASCPDASNNKYTVFFVPLANPTTSSPSTPPNPLSNVGPQTPKAVFTLFTARPAAPGNVKGGKGQRILTLSWDKASGALNTTTYRAYFDTTVGENCAGSHLVAGQTSSGLSVSGDAGVDAATSELDAGDADGGNSGDAGTDTVDASTDTDLDAAMDVTDAEAADAVDAEAEVEQPSSGVKLSSIPGVYSMNTKTERNATLADLDERDVQIGDYVSAAVVTVDISGNESVLSEVACLQRVYTENFPALCEADPECRDGFNSCTVNAPGLGRSAGLALTLLFGIGVALRVRRRRHV